MDPDRVLSDSEELLVGSVRKEIGLPSADTLMCKTIPQSDIYKYLYNQYDGARLDYNNTEFKTTNGVDGFSKSIGLPDKFYGTIEYKVNDVDKISIPNWKPKPDDYPYTGRAFTGSTDVVLPEYFQDTRKFVDGDIIKIMDGDTGKVVQQYIYGMDSDTKWFMIGGN